MQQHFGGVDGGSLIRRTSKKMERSKKESSETAKKKINTGEQVGLELGGYRRGKKEKGNGKKYEGKNEITNFEPG